MKKSIVIPSLLISTSAFAGLFGTDVVVPSVPAAPTVAAPAAATDLAQISSKLVTSAKSLLSSPQVSDAMKAQVTTFTDSVLANKDGAASAALDKIVALKPSADQTTVLKEVQTNFGVLALGRNFDPKDPASSGVVKQTVDALKAKDTAGTLAGLQKLGTRTKLTDGQKEIVTNLVSSYGGKLAGVTDKVNKAEAALKGFGL